jgi:diguanylate cyclase (GGDEF)-like protein
MSEELKKENKKLKEEISELEVELTRLEEDLIHDHLTRLKTRKFFEEEVNVYLESIAQKDSRRKEWFGFKNLSVILFDIDYFKSINDTYGHSAGDDVLKKVAETIKDGLRTGDTVARWGGEEIIAILLGADEEDASEKAEEIREAVGSFKFKGIDKPVTLSSGVASAEAGINLAELVGRADKALYEAKETGRNKVVTYSKMS